MKWGLKYALGALFGFLFLGINGASSISYRGVYPFFFDRILLRNHAPYLVEGIGGLSLLLGEEEEKILHTWGAPTIRDYEERETLYYQREEFEGKFILERGYIQAIIYYLRRNHKNPNLKFETALGLKEEDIENLSYKELQKYLKEFYQKHYRKSFQLVSLPNWILIPRLGIGFEFQKDRLIAVHIFPPY